MSPRLKYHINRFLQEHLDYRLQPDRPYSIPSGFLVETHMKCNLKCPMCPREIDPPIHSGEDQGQEVFEATTTYLPYADCVVLSGLNEPLMDRQIIDKIRRVKEAGSVARLISNCVLLTESIARQLVAVQLDSLTLSMEGATPDIYSSLRVGANLDKVKRNVKRLTAIKAEQNSFRPFLQIGCCIMQQNLPDIPLMPVIAKEMGVSRVNLTETIYYSETMKSAAAYDPEQGQAALAEAQRMGAELGVEVNYLPYPSEAYLDAQTPPSPEQTPPTEPSDQFICHELYTRLIVLANGNVTPCCYMYHRPVGNLRKQSLKEIWRGPAMADLRKRIRTGDPLPECRGCIHLKQPGEKPEW